MPDSKLIALYRSVIDEAFSKGNLQVLDRTIASNMVEHETGVEPPNIQGLRNMINMMRTAYPDLRMTIEDVWEIGDRVIGRCRLTGTHKGPVGDLPPTGKRIDLQCIDIVRFSGDKCVEHWGVTDRMAMMEQIGVVQPMHA